MPFMIFHVMIFMGTTPIHIQLNVESIAKMPEVYLWRTRLCARYFDFPISPPRFDHAVRPQCFTGPKSEIFSDKMVVGSSMRPII